VSSKYNAFTRTSVSTYVSSSFSHSINPIDKFTIIATISHALFPSANRNMCMVEVITV